MEVISSPPFSSDSSCTTTGARVRVAYYLRPRDISSRYIADHRLVVATMHTDVVPGEYIRGICTVRHKESIKDMEGFKREPDAFYWTQLYDRYLHRYFDAISTDKIQNAPAEVVKYLAENFDHILCEPSISAELCDAQRGCTTCFKWASNPESVTCARCRSVFHLDCLDPPLAQKPKIGYSWSCAPCSKAHDEEVETYMETGIAPTKKVLPDQQKGKDKGKGKEKETSKEKANKGKGKEVDSGRIRSTHGWPFRYFGMHSDAYAVLDPHDSLYPRASTRLGNKFQVVVPAWDPDQSARASTSIVKTGNGKGKARSRHIMLEKPSLKLTFSIVAENVAVPRGQDEAAKLLFKEAPGLTDDKLDTFVRNIKELPLYATAGVDLIDRGLSFIRNDNTAAALVAARKATPGSVGHPGWTQAERDLLTEGALHHGNDIDEISAEIPTKKIGDVVKRYYISIGHSMQEDVPQQIEEKVAAAAKVERKGKGPAKGKCAVDSDDEGSICGAARTPAAKRARICAVCAVKTTPMWYRCPESIGSPTKTTDIHVMCRDCGLRWRHFGMQYPPTTAEDLKLIAAGKPARKGEKVEPESKKKDSVKYRAIVPPVPSKPPPPKPCLLCKKLEPKVILAECIGCAISIHTSCYGASADTSTELWRCDSCIVPVRGKKPPVARPQCLLCPPRSPNDDSAPLSALDIFKPTEGRNSVHLICAVWHPEIRFSEGPKVLAEALPTIPSKRRLQTCTLCHVNDVGACIKCEDCNKYFHAACAWTAGCRFAFEIHPLRKKRAKDVIAVKFKDEDGDIAAGVWCSDHQFSHLDRITYDITTVDPRSKLTALQTYIAANQPAIASDTFPVLRRARRLDALVESVLKPSIEEAPPALTVIPEVGMLPVPALPQTRPTKRPSLPVLSERPTKLTKTSAARAKVAMKAQSPAPEAIDMPMPESHQISSPLSLSAILNPVTASIVPEAHSFVSPSPPGALMPGAQPARPYPKPTPPPAFTDSVLPHTFIFPDDLPPLPTSTSSLIVAPSPRRPSAVLSIAEELDLLAADPVALHGFGDVLITAAPTGGAIPMSVSPPIAPPSLESPLVEPASSLPAHPSIRIPMGPSGAHRGFKLQDEHRITATASSPVQQPHVHPAPSQEAAPIPCRSPEGVSVPYQTHQRAHTTSSVQIPTSPVRGPVSSGQGVRSAKEHGKASPRSSSESLVVTLKIPPRRVAQPVNYNFLTLPPLPSPGGQTVPLLQPGNELGLEIDGGQSSSTSDSGLNDSSFASGCSKKRPPDSLTICSNCSVGTSTLWRRDEEGRHLCNACGLFYKGHGSHRPSGVFARGSGPTRVSTKLATTYTESNGGLRFVDDGGTAPRGKRQRHSSTPVTFTPPPHSPIFTAFAAKAHPDYLLQHAALPSEVALSQDVSMRYQPAQASPPKTLDGGPSLLSTFNSASGRLVLPPLPSTLSTFPLDPSLESLPLDPVLRGGAAATIAKRPPDRLSMPQQWFPRPGSILRAKPPRSAPRAVARQVLAHADRNKLLPNNPHQKNMQIKYFCSVCGTQLYSTNDLQVPGGIVVKVGSIDDEYKKYIASDVSMEMFCDRQMPFLGKVKGDPKTFAMAPAGTA
ncbi:hypothetical protein P7C70_g5687, partial [Phenoliferia sp. Uapishka_3]